MKLHRANPDKAGRKIGSRRLVGAQDLKMHQWGLWVHEQLKNFDVLDMRTLLSTHPGKKLEESTDAIATSELLHFFGLSRRFGPGASTTHAQSDCRLDISGLNSGQFFNTFVPSPTAAA